MTRVLITGAKGMVGRNIVEHPLALNYDLLTPSRSELDLSTFGAVVDYIQRHSPEVIVHCAGLVGGIHANIANPVNFLVSNLDLGRNIIMAAKVAGIRKLINLGSSCMYPRLANNPLREESILTGELEPTNEGYALAKLVTMRLCEYMTRSDNRNKYKTLIPCNLYGRFDNFDPSTSHMVPAIIQKIHQAKANGEPSVAVWGDGTVRREFMYAEDFAHCIWCALHRFDSLPPVMNVGIGRDWSISDYYRIIADTIGYKGRFEYDRSKPVGMTQKLVDVTKMREWGWTSQINLEDGLRLTYEYYLEKFTDG